MSCFSADLLASLCAGSITTYSLYAPRFLTHLRYTQLQVNAISIAAEMGLYLLVPLFGYLCDRYSPAPLSLLASLLFGAGYVLAAVTYKAGPPAGSGVPDANGLPFHLMIVAFIAVGAATACMYLSAVATCAKNYSRSTHRGLILALPIAAFGLSGMWQSQIGAHLLYERLSDGSKGDVDVFKYFLFLALLLAGVGLLGALTLKIVDEEGLIDRGVEELERSGLLQDSEFFHPHNRRTPNYGAINQHDSEDDSDMEADLSESMLLKKQQEEAQLRRKKSWLLNHATSTFLSDRTMWLLAAGFFLVTGPGEAYINNVGTIIPALTPNSKTWTGGPPPAGRPSIHVSIIALTSTLARIFTGTMSDIFAPPPNTHTQRTTNPNPNPKTPSLSRLSLLLPSALLLSLAFLTLSLPGLVPTQPPLLLLTSALLGLGYGACFSLVPIIISVVWDVENFATNWGIVAVMPAPGAALWGVVYSVEWGRGAATGGGGDGGGGGGEGFGECRGRGCFEGWAWGCAGSVGLAVLLWGWAWRGWRRRGVVV